ncbi:MAG: hypothetical protein K0S53_2630 [Bacteroidetes bacterium]|jgi:hypothetical protein|nr:hypothetical protein [Bacteroidota bacterium]
MKRITITTLAVAITAGAIAQELYPNSEPASITPKHVLGIRSMNEVYSSDGNFKSWHGAMFMYGVSSKLMLNAMITTSNHHYKTLPANYIQKDANQKEYVVQPSSPNKYLFESINLGFRYRFMNFDQDHRHFRMALYGNGVYAQQPHDEAEVSLMGDNKGVGGGLISTVLLNKLAVSLTTGFVKPFSYKENSSAIALNYGNAYNYSLSFGYLIYPRKYKNYNQTNINLYAEFLGKAYDALTVTNNSYTVIATDEPYQKGNYIEFRPAIQFIVKSNLRIDASTAFPLVNKSYIRKYPLYLLNVQYYFFRRPKKSNKNVVQ